MFVIILLLGFSLLTTLGGSLYWQWLNSPERVDFRNLVAVNYDSQYWAETPESHVAAGEALLQGIKEVGLTRNSYINYFSWQHTKGNSVGFYIDYIQTTIDRGYDTVRWKEDLLVNKTVSEITNDLYEAKMDELRSNVDNVNSKDRLRNAVLVKNPGWAFSGLYFWIGLLGLVVIVVIIGAKMEHYSYHDNSFWYKDPPPP